MTSFDWTLAVGLALFTLAWACFWLLKYALSFSVEGEEEELRELPPDATLERDTKIEVIGILRTLEAITLTISGTLMPIAGVVLGMVLPKPYRAFLTKFFGTESLIVVTVAALFAYFAVFRILKRHEGPRFNKALKDMFRSGRASPPSE